MSKLGIVKGSLLLMWLVFAAVTEVSAQISEGGMPPSYALSQRKTLERPPGITLEKMDVEKLKAEDRQNPGRERYSVFQDVVIDLRTSGLVTEIPEESGTIHRYMVSSPNGKTIQVYFDIFMLPPGARLYLYSIDYKVIYGAFTSRNNNTRNSLMIADLPASDVIIEYFEPEKPAFEGELQIGAIGQAYKDIMSASSSVDEDGYINVNCPEGLDWQLEKHSVCRITFRINDAGYLCTGALVNNERNDGTPLFLTANHCLDTESAAATLVADFNYEYFGCSDFPRAKRSLSGSTLLTTGKNSDFTLLQLDNVPPLDYQPYYAGWDASGDSGTNATGIHHPQGLRKKIAFDYSPPENYPFVINWSDNNTSPPDTHWKVVFDLGRTNTGSSGSPVFNEQRRIIGQLHGGNEVTKYYGRLDYSWENSSAGMVSDLRDYLDPDSTGIVVMDGLLPDGIKPDPQFIPAFKEVCADAPIQLTGFSGIEADSWSWSFTPDNVIFEEGSDASSSAPIVRFPENGTYDVTLSAANTHGSNQGVFVNAISASGSISVGIDPLGMIDSCLCSLDSIPFRGTGATDFNWKLANNLESIFELDTDTSQVVNTRIFNKPDTTVYLTLELTGKHGTCADSVAFTLPLFIQANDSVHNAHDVSVGKTSLLSNRCANIEPGEPIPPAGECTGQLSWCDEFGNGENIVENSVWFRFVPDSTSDYAISSAGMDNQIALYRANGSEDLLSGNYELLGANDDATDINFNPLINRVRLEKDQPYFIQVDGSFGNIEGSFRLIIDMLPGVFAEENQSRQDVRVYPQPAGHEIRIAGEMLPGSDAVRVELFDASGKIVYSDLSVPTPGGELSVPVAGFRPGIYLLRIISDSRHHITTVLKQ